MCWRCVGSVAGWRWVAQPHPAPASAVPGLTALVPHCQPSPVVPGTQACTLHTSNHHAQQQTSFKRFFGAKFVSQVLPRPQAMSRGLLKEGCFFTLLFNGEIVLQHSLLGNHLMSCVLSPTSTVQCMIQEIVVPLIGGGWAAGGVETIDS